MARHTHKSILERLSVFRNAWLECAPEKSFGGMTLADFEAATAPLLNVQTQIQALEAQVANTRAKRLVIEDRVRQAMNRVINGVRASPDHGEDSPLYRAFGYTRKSERASGLTRKRSNEPTPPTDADAA